ncbi:AI-2E family transporter [Caldovatus aquaticus]|uniref:AI-2E family transporter n=1 Tax=Caldovatus aquaticus TaxID=2865671 RepID=A0ABS7F1Y2_9PROT|nr:AI-2E family transporter [Caldovatus aquaticus]MBW8269579.1 AI-2E family transporter [Caldovatus aquaticus]
MPPSEEPAPAARLIGLVALLALGIGCLMVLRPFLSALLWAAILAYSTWPAYRVVRDRLRLSSGFAAGLMVAAEMLLVGLPIVFAAPTSREEVEALRAQLERLLTVGIPGLGDWLLGLPYVGGFLRDRLGGLAFDLSGLGSLLRPYAGTIASAALAALLAVLSGVAELLLAIVLAFFFYRDGEAMAGRAARLVVRIGGARAQRLLALTGNVTRSVVFGLIGTAVVQGILTAFGLWIAGVPQPVLLGVVAGALSILPVGAPLVWIPATIWLFVEGEVGWGIFMGLYGALGISSVDNVIRPVLISRGADLPLLLTLLGALGGVLAFGFLGLFLGPVLLAVGYALLLEFSAEERAEDAPRETGASGEGA